METKKIFWKLVNALEGVSDTIVKNEQGVVIEKGMKINSDYSIMYVLDKGTIKVCSFHNESLLEFDGNSPIFEALSELFEQIYLDGQAKSVAESDKQISLAEFIVGIQEDIKEIKKSVAALEGQAQKQLKEFNHTEFAKNVEHYVSKINKSEDFKINPKK